MKVEGLRDHATPGPVKVYRALKDSKGNIIRDKAGNPVLGKPIKLYRISKANREW